MSSITIKLLSGVGVNGYYGIYRDGVAVGSIRRNGNRGCIIVSRWYSETLASYRNVEQARTAALTLDYPGAWQVYETICQRVEQQRRAWFEKDWHHKMVELVRDMATGSNSARDRAAELVGELERLAKDRGATGEALRAAAHAAGKYTDGQPTYPEQPEQAKPVAA